MRRRLIAVASVLLALAPCGASATESFPPPEPEELAQHRQRHDQKGWIYLATDSGFAFYARNLRRVGPYVYYEDGTVPLPITDNPMDLPDQRLTTGRVNCLTRRQSHKLDGVWEHWEGAAAEVRWFCSRAISDQTESGRSGMRRSTSALRFAPDFV